MCAWKVDGAHVHIHIECVHMDDRAVNKWFQIISNVFIKRASCRLPQDGRTGTHDRQFKHTATAWLAFCEITKWNYIIFSATVPVNVSDVNINVQQSFGTNLARVTSLGPTSRPEVPHLAQLVNMHALTSELITSTIACRTNCILFLHVHFVNCSTDIDAA